MPTSPTFDLLAKIHAARAELDQTVLRLVEKGASAPRLRRGRPRWPSVAQGTAARSSSSSPGRGCT